VKYLAFATDYDGTLAKDGHVAAHVLQAIERVRAAGLKTLLVTGRQMPELRALFPRIDLFDAIVAENGAELLLPPAGREEILGDPPSTEFLAEMKRLDVTPFSVGKVIFATWRPHEAVIAQSIIRLGLDYQIIFNKDAVMVLPKGINKATGVASALERLGISSSQLAGIGDAENDLPLLRICGWSGAVANALPSVKARSQFVAAHDHGAGVVEFIGKLLKEPTAACRAAPSRADPSSRPQLDGR
jgi:hydroxymethylpyrimidine pyrophosphatase-like HAD family hydrolase